MTRPLVNVVGNLGTGKTTFARNLAEIHGFHLEEESVGDNPFLSGYYADMNRWSFHLELYFLADRLKKQELALAAPSKAVIDGSIYGDYHVFTQLLREFGHLSEDEFAIVSHIYSVFKRTCPKPDLLVFLTASPEVLVSRIRHRGLELDRGLSIDYLRTVNTLFEHFVSSFQVCPSFSIDVEQRDLRDPSESIYDEILRVTDQL